MIMKILSTILLTLLIVLGACTSPQVSPDPFVRVSNGRLTVNGKPYYYIGTNFWYGAILGSQGQGGNRERLLRELDYLKALGINNLRVLVGADGKDGIPTKAEPALQVEAGVYNDTIFDGLDFFLSELDKRDMYAVLFLNNSWEWSGGYSQYLYWAGHGEVPMPNVAGWDAFSNYVAQYAKSEKAHHLFRDHITYVVNRVNRYTGKKYSEDRSVHDVYILKVYFRFISNACRQVISSEEPPTIIVKRPGSTTHSPSCIYRANDFLSRVKVTSRDSAAFR